jgi:hypothetical protein
MSLVSVGNDQLSEHFSPEKYRRKIDFAQTTINGFKNNTNNINKQSEIEL